MPPATTTSTLHVRRARLADLPFLQQDGNIPSHEVRRKIEIGDLFVADRGVEPVGFLRIDFFRADLPMIASIFVFEEFRKRGVGRLLVDHACVVIRERGFRVLYLSSPSDQPGALAWIRRLEFEECGYLSGMPGEAGTLFFRRSL